jgi:hypothetical protein
MKPHRIMLDRLYVYKYNLDNQIETLNEHKVFQVETSDYDVHKRTIELKEQQLNMVCALIDLYLETLK